MSAVETARLMFSVCFAPNICDMIMEHPVDIPVATAMNSAVTGVLVPTDASAFSPTKLPTMMVSTIL